MSKIDRVASLLITVALFAAGCGDETSNREAAPVAPSTAPPPQPVDDGPPWPADPAPFPGEHFTWLREPLAGWRHVSSVSGQYRMQEIVTGGVVLLDADGDGDLDVFLVTGGTWSDLTSAAPFPGHALFRNDGGLHFTNIAQEAGPFGEAGSYAIGATAADFDNDGDQDLFVTGSTRCWLYRNDGVREEIPRFTECAEALGVRGNGKWSTSACFFDGDRDGRLDLYVANYVEFSLAANERLQCGVETTGVRDYCSPKDFLGTQDYYFHHEGDHFRECAVEVGLVVPAPLASNGKGLGVVATDVENDGDLDLYVANDGCPNLLFVNDGSGHFKERGLAHGCALSSDGKSQAGMGTDAGDFDGDGDLDLWVTNLDLETNGLYRNDGGGFFEDDVRASGLAACDHGAVGFGTDFFDADNDGDQDLIVANGHVVQHIFQTRGTLTFRQADQFFENDGRGHFRLLAPPEAGAYFAVRNLARGLATGDLDGDGDLDVVIVARDEPAVLLRNNHAPPQRAPDSLLLELRGTTSARDAIGARAWLTAGGKTQVEEVRAGSSYASRCDLRLHFGLGETTNVDTLRIRWPNGSVQEFGSVLAGFEYRVTEGGAIETLRPLVAR